MAQEIFVDRKVFAFGSDDKHHGLRSDQSSSSRQPYIGCMADDVGTYLMNWAMGISVTTGVEVESLVVLSGRISRADGFQHSQAHGILFGEFETKLRCSRFLHYCLIPLSDP